MMSSPFENKEITRKFNADFEELSKGNAQVSL